ncbi:hypothetical protein BH10CHL1_BH10CHL1_22090 [soil metagenome]
MTITNHQTIGKQWGDRWFAMLQDFGLATIAARTKPTTRGSRITRLEVLVGEISGEVQSPTHGACRVTIQLAPWDNETWTHVIDTLGSQPFFVTQAMAGNLPLELEQTLQQLNAPLLPTSPQELIQTCSCDTSARQPCPELLVVHRQFSEMLNEEPWLLLRLRGRDRQQILQSLQTRRNGNNGALANGPATPAQAQPREAETYVHRPGSDLAAPSEAASLTDQIDQFWGSRRQLESFHHHIAPPSIDLVLLRRLGPPTSTADGSLAYEALSALYRQVTAEALTLAYATEASEQTNERTE